jgi:hypothetical protein
MSNLTLSPFVSVDGVLQQAGLVTCSVCLSVWQGRTWISAEQAILELRTFALWEPLRLAPGLCDGCRSDFAARRGHAVRKVA